MRGPFAAREDPLWGHCPLQSCVEGKSWVPLANASSQILTEFGEGRGREREKGFGVSDDWQKLHEILSTYSESESLKGSCHEGPIQTIQYFHFDLNALN